LRLLASIPVALTTAVAIAACGGGGSGNSVATVDGTPITQTAFTHYVTIAAKSDGGAAVPDAPKFTACIAAKKKTSAKSTPAQLKAMCQKSYSQYRQSALSQLISAQWVKAEAASRHLTVTPAAVKTTFQQQKTQAYPKAADYQTFLKQSGQTQADLMDDVKVSLLASKISAQVVKGKDTVTSADIAAYYAKNKSQYAKPETRNLRVVINKSKTKAAAAAVALKHGGSWTSVAKKYSTDTTSSAKGGEVDNVAKASLPAGLAKPIFSAKNGQIIGPVTSSGNSYVFTVIKDVPASQQTLAQATSAIKSTLQSSKQQSVLQSWAKGYQTRWRAKTQCTGDLKVSSCANGPKPTPTPTAAPATGAPTGG
jgi:foldase protein PrsA